MLWKYNWSSECRHKPVKNLDDVEPEYFDDLIFDCWSKDAPVPAEKLVEYIVESQRSELLSLISIECAIRMLYDPSIRETGLLKGDDYLRLDRTHCFPEQRRVFRKAIALKDQFEHKDYSKSYLYETAIFEICRRNDVEMLKIYLDEFQGYCPSELYDAVFDYYIYMYLPEWDLLRQYNNTIGSIGELPGCCSIRGNTVSREIQQTMLNILIQQSEKCKVPHPEALQILFDHHIPSCSSAFPIREQCLHLGTLFSNQYVFDKDCFERILFHYEDKDIADDNCIDPRELNDLLTESCCAVPVTCTCGEAGCGGIHAVSESWVMGNEIRLYIPAKKVFYCRIEDRIAMKKELLMALQQAIRNVQRYKAWYEKNIGKYDGWDEPIAPHGTTSSSWRQLCRKITKSLV